MSKRWIFPQIGPSSIPRSQATTAMAAMPVEAPDARKSAPMRRAWVHIGTAVDARSTPV